jgi:hypothetical protein
MFYILFYILLLCNSFVTCKTSEHQNLWKLLDINPITKFW